MNELPDRVGINAVFLQPGMGGLETYVRRVMPELLTAAPSTRFVVYTSQGGAEQLRQDAWAAQVHLVTHPLLGLSGLKAVTELTLLGWLAGRQVELLHSVAMTAPLRSRAVNAVLIPDVIWLHGDHPDPTTRLWRAIVPPVARRADRVMAISQVTADEIVRQLGVPAARVDVTPLGYSATRVATPLAPDAVRTRFGLRDGPLVLIVATRKPHKNVLGALDAMPAVLAVNPTATLVLAGNPTAHEPALLERVEQLGIAEHVAFLPFVSDQELEGLYDAATCFVLPSFLEGFGLPILEAMGRGVPVACSNVSALPEVAGDAARYFDPARPGEIAAAINDVLADETLRQRMIERGLTRAGAQTWAATAESTLESWSRAWHGTRRDIKAG